MVDAVAGCSPTRPEMMLQQTLSKPAVVVKKPRARTTSHSTPRGIGTPRGAPPRGSVAAAAQRARKRSIGQPRESRSSPL